MVRQAHGDDTDFAPFGDDYKGFDPRDADASGRGPLILVLAVGVLLIFAAVVWNTYRQGVRSDSETPFLAADAAAYKRAPEDRGGRDVPGTNLQFYDQMDGSERPINAQEAEAALLKGGPPASLRRGLDPDADISEPSSARDYAETETTVRETPLTAPTIPTETAALEPETPESEAAERVSAEPASPSPATGRAVEVSPWGIESSGPFLVQVGAFRSEAAADQAWQKLTTDGVGLLDQANKNIQRADLGARGIFFRLRAGSFTTRDNATQFCNALKERRIACMVVS